MAAALAKLLVVASMALAPSSWREKGGRDVERRRKEPEEGREGTLLCSSGVGDGGLRRRDGQTRTVMFGHELAVELEGSRWHVGGMGEEELISLVDEESEEGWIDGLGWRLTLRGWIWLAAW